MKVKFYFIPALIFLILHLVLGFGIIDEMQAATNKPTTNPTGLVSMDFQNANLKDVLKVFSQQSGLNFIASQSVQDRTVTLYFENVTIEDALKQLMEANNLTYEQPKGSNIFLVKESGRPEVETITRIYELKFAQLAELTTAKEKASEGGSADGNTSKAQSPGRADIKAVIEKLLTKNGILVTDRRSNSLIITDVPSQFTIIEETLARLDVKAQQVMIEAEILEVDTVIVEKLGIDWTGTFATYKPPEKTTAAPFRGDFAKTSGDSGSITVGTLAFGSGPATAMATLNALYSNSGTKILARPRILTLNNEIASIEITSKTAVASITTTTSVTGQATTSAERIQTGITLDVTPQINKGGYVTMQIEPKVIVPIASKFFTSGTQNFVDPQTRGAKTTVMLKDGETVVIGGLISTEDTSGFEKIPFLGDIPILGEFFKHRSKDSSDKELIIFITPHVIKDTLPGLSKLTEREQEELVSKKEEEVELLLELLGR